MVALNIYSLDDTERANVIACLPEGKHIIGRGDLLKISDKRVSRKHAVIEVTNDKITITSVHVNPCFFKACNGRALTVIALNEDNELNDGDQFALLPEDCWFQVKIKREESHENGKRVLDNIEEENMSKKPKLFCTNDDQPSTSNKTHEENEQGAKKAAIETTEIKQESTEIKQSQEIKEPDVPENASEMQGEAQPLIKTENNEDKTAPDAASPTGPKKRRERCWYAPACFRANPNHRETFSHPGDQDYESDPDDDRPDCPYGAACYRRNIDHRQEYKHVARPAHKPIPAPPVRANLPGSPTTQNTPNKRKRQRKATRKTKPQADSDSDDYDYNDPFLNDGSSDDFDPSDYDDGSDSDWEDSEELESQDRKRMIREAKKFTRNKKN